MEWEVQELYEVISGMGGARTLKDLFKWRLCDFCGGL